VRRPATHWAPAPAAYSVVQQTDVAVRMTDGTVLRADIASPADRATGRPAAGPFPVLLTQTPYGKDTAGATNSSAIGIDTYRLTAAPDSRRSTPGSSQDAAERRRRPRRGLRSSAVRPAPSAPASQLRNCA
jgi:hypothetical protein